MARDTEHEREAVIAAIERAKGKITLAAHMLGVTPQTVYNYANRWKTVQDAIDQARRDFRDSLVDKAEIKLEKAVEHEQAWAIKYALKTQGKERGYTERQEWSGPDGGPLQHETKDISERNAREDAAYIAAVIRELDTVTRKTDSDVAADTE